MWILKIDKEGRFDFWTVGMLMQFFTVHFYGEETSDQRYAFDRCLLFYLLFFVHYPFGERASFEWDLHISVETNQDKNED
jgi:hypothetical protein